MPADYTYTILEFDSSRDFPTTGSIDTIYIDTERNLPFRWNGEYIQVSTTDSEIWGILGTILASGGGGGVPYTGATQDVNLGEYGITAGQFTLDTTPTGTAVAGTTQWNDSLGSSQTTLKGGTVLLKNGVDLVARVVNKVNPAATLTRANYTAVRISGAQGQRLAVDYAKADTDLNSADTIGLVVENIAANQEGFVMTVGQLIGVNTTGSLQGETWADGDVLYLSPTTAGRITNIKPTGATGHIVVIGYVEYAHAIHGKIYVKIMNGWELDELHNVYINSVANNDLLQYDSATQLWKNESLSAAGVQPTLVSGTNIKTINGSSVLGSGDLIVGSSGLQGIHAVFPIVSGDQVSSNMQSSGTGSGGPFSANRLVAYPFIPNQSFTSSNLQINVTVLGVGSLCRIAVYTDLNGAPNTSIFISSNLDCSTTGLKTATASINFVAGTTYWLAFHGGTGSSISQIGVNMMYPLKFANINTMANHINKVLSFALPTPTTFGGGNTYAASNMPLILITKA